MFTVTEENLGRLKHTTDETCDDCHRGKLQLRVRKDDGKDIEYLYCPKCFFEKEPNKSKLQGIFKKQLKEVEDYENSLQSGANSRRNDKNRNPSNRGYNKRSS